MRPHADRWAESLLRLKETAERQEGAGMSVTLEVEQEVTVAAPREKVFEALCRMGEWWPHAFREGSAVHLEPRVGGRFWEDWGDGDGALYATVTGIRRPELLTCTGPMGMRTPVTGVWTMELAERDGATLVRLSHHAVGPIDDETRAAYQHGWGEVFDALRSHLGLGG
jgi:uncharacterized protein YndB with AHSA1/START domain